MSTDHSSQTQLRDNLSPKVRGLRPACLHNYIQGAPGTMAHGIRGSSKLRMEN